MTTLRAAREAHRGRRYSRWLQVWTAVTLALTCQAKDEVALERFGYELSPAGVRQCLNDIVWTAEREALYLRCLDDLGAEDFATRETAMHSLIALPSLPHKRLHDEAMSAATDIDKKQRILQVLNHNTSFRLETILYHAADLISARDGSGTEREAYRGLATELVAATDVIDVKQRAVWDATLRAIRSTATGDDFETLRQGLQRSGPMARAASVAGIATLDDPAEALAAIKPLLEDEDDRVRYQAAVETQAKASRDCVPAFISLLDSTVPYRKWGLHLRFRAIQALKDLTGLDHGYRAGLKPEDRKAPIEKWKAWFETEGATAPLQFNGAIIDETEIMTDHEGRPLVIRSLKDQVTYTRKEDGVRRLPTLLFGSGVHHIAAPELGEAQALPAIDLNDNTPIRLSIDLDEPAKPVIVAPRARLRTKPLPFRGQP